MDQLRALSVRQPWAHSIVHHGKDIENRSRRFGHRGLTLIHASAGISPEEYADAAAFIERAGHAVPALAQLERGGIVGAVEIVDSVSASPSPWWMGPFGLVLTAARALPFIPCKGTVAPLFWLPDPDTLARVRAAL